MKKTRLASVATAMTQSIQSLTGTLDIHYRYIGTKIFKSTTLTNAHHNLAFGKCINPACNRQKFYGKPCCSADCMREYKALRREMYHAMKEQKRNAK